jgi:ATP-dependent exoDNAse (exonuclease V) beta subunit
MWNSHAADLPNRLIRASAGTGKTFQLTNRFLALILGGVPPDRILAATFTRKAAGEILDRVILRLAKAALDDGQRDELRGILGAATLSQSHCVEALHGLLHDLHRFRIGTLDSLFVQLARSFSLELDLPGAWRVVDPVQEARFRDQAIEALLRQEETSDLVNLAHLLTKGETQRGVAELIRATVQELHDLYLDAAADSWERLSHPKPLEREAVQFLLDELSSATFQDRRFTKARDVNLERAIANDWEAFAKQGLAAKVLAGVEKYYGKPIPAEVRQTYEKLLDHARALLLTRLAMQNEGAHDLLHRYDREFRQLRRERRALRFSDITRELAARFSPLQGTSVSAEQRAGENARPGEALAYRLDGHILHLLLDEFQDTAPAQWSVLQPFANLSVQDNPHRTFLCVGDVKQAIYGWRGGVAEIFDAVGHQLPGLDYQQLNTSYRSSQPVIDTVNRVFQSLTKHPNLGNAESAVKAWQKRFTEHAAHRTELGGYVVLETAPLPREDQQPVDATLEHAAQTVASLAEAHPGQSIGVLVRKNATVGQLIYRMRRLNVAASEEGGNPLIDSAAVQILLSVLRLADHPGDTIARFHIAASPVGEALRLANPFDDAAANAAAGRVRRRILDVGYGAAIAQWAEALFPKCSRREQNRLEQFVELAYAYQGRATLRAGDFIELVERQRIADPTSADVRVMTIHQSKGLEFDTVILPELDASLTGQPDTFVVERKDPAGPVHRVCHYVSQELQPLLPKAMQRMFSTATDRWVTEALCVLYVALTRPVNELRLIIAPSIKSERQRPRTYAGLLRSTLANSEHAAPETVLYECGDRTWRERVAGPDLVREPSPARETKLDRALLAPASGSRQRGLERVSPSSLEGGNRVRLADTLQSGNRAALARGTLMHALFEQIEWLDDGPPDQNRLQDALRAVALEQGMTTMDLEHLLEDFRGMLAAPAIDAVLRREAYQPVAKLDLSDPVDVPAGAKVNLTVSNERTFAVRDGDRAITGSIDRLVLLDVDGQLIAADVLDFKSDVVDPGDRSQLEQRKAYYRPQLAAYRLATAKLTGLPPQRIATRLAFVSAGLVESV